MDGLKHKKEEATTSPKILRKNISQCIESYLKGEQFPQLNREGSFPAHLISQQANSIAETDFRDKENKNDSFEFKIEQFADFKENRFE